MTASPNSPRRRPFALLVLAALLTLKAILTIAVVIGAGLAQSGMVPGLVKLVPEVGAVLQLAVLWRGVLILLAVLLLIAAIGLIALERRGWVLAMVLTGVFVAFDIWAWTQGTASHAWMALNIVTVFYLNQSDVRAALGVSAEPLIPGVEIP